MAAFRSEKPILPLLLSIIFIAQMITAPMFVTFIITIAKLGLFSTS